MIYTHNSNTLSGYFWAKIIGIHYVQLIWSGTSRQSDLPPPPHLGTDHLSFPLRYYFSIGLNVVIVLGHIYALTPLEFCYQNCQQCLSHGEWGNHIFHLGLVLAGGGGGGGGGILFFLSGSSTPCVSGGFPSLGPVKERTSSMSHTPLPPRLPHPPTHPPTLCGGAPHTACSPTLSGEHLGHGGTAALSVVCYFSSALAVALCPGLSPNTLNAVL